MAEESYAPYPTAIRPGMRKLGSLDAQNASVGDFGASVRNQGTIASCASFGFVGLLENQLFNERGISPDISERFMLFSNFLQTGSLGGDPAVVARFPKLVSNLGLLPETDYPYAAILPNAHRFEQDAAQGLNGAASTTSLASAIEGTSNDSRERSMILQRSDFLGQLPAAPYPIALPIKAKLQPGAKVPEIEFEGNIYSCYSAEGSAATRPERVLRVTPRELLSMCFDFQPASYFTCSFDLAKVGQAIEASVGNIEDECARASEVATRLTAPWLEANRKSLSVALSLIDSGDAALIAVNAPASPNNALPVWSTKSYQSGSGHAVLAVGYLTYEELASASEQSRGLLATGMFDRLAATVDPDFEARLRAGLPESQVERRDLRVRSRLGERMKTEGGIVLFRNSWGARVDDVAIGVEGHQAMTFDFFLREGLLVQGRKSPRAAGVDWRDAEENACPRNVAFTKGGEWLTNAARAAELTAHIRKLSIPATCNP